MKGVLIIFLLTFAWEITDDHQNRSETKFSHPIKSEILLTKLDDLIDFRDSLTESRNSRITKSFWIYFSYKENDCFVTILAHPLDAYDREEMDGYFIQRGRFVSVYDSKLHCGSDFVDTKLLHTGKIKKLNEYWPSKNNKHQSFPPHNTYGREYRIINKENLELISEGYHLERPLPKHRIPPKPVNYGKDNTY